MLIKVADGKSTGKGLLLAGDVSKELLVRVFDGEKMLKTSCW